ncbi:MAG: ADOP family duplicated permease [Gemmatimonadales bacterium]
MASLWRRLRAAIFRTRLDRDLDDEVRFHIEMEARRNRERGLPEEEARRQALVSFGGVERFKEESRDTRGIGALETLTRDLRGGARALRRTPGTTVITVLTIGLVIGAASTIFSSVRTVLLRPLPVPGIDRLAVVRDDLPGLGLREAEVSPAEVLDLRARRDLFEAFSGITVSPMNLTGEADPRRIMVGRSMGDFFETFGVQPYLGRLFDARASEPGRPRVAVLGNAFWRTQLGGDASILGRTIQLDGIGFEVIGVLPPGFRYPRNVQVWVPFVVTEQWLARRGSLFMLAVGRRLSTVSPEQLSAQLALEADRWHQAYEYPERFQHRLAVHSFTEFDAGQLRPILLALLGAVGLLLLLASANVASLQLLRATGRTRELAVRAALGAGRRALVRALLVESSVLAGLGAVLGLGLAFLATGYVAGAPLPDFPALADVQLDAGVVAAGLMTTLLTAVAFSVAPALRAARIDAAVALRQGAGSGLSIRRHRFLRSSIVIQVAVSMILLLGSALTVRSLRRLLDVDLGFAPGQVLSFGVALPAATYPTGENRSVFFTGLQERLEAVPGIQRVGLASYVPFAHGSGDSSPFDLPGVPERTGEPQRHANLHIVGGEYFRTMGIPLLKGRTFSSEDRADGERHVVIDETLARTWFREIDPIGQEITQGGPPSRIIGVVGSVRLDFSQEPKATVYYPYSQTPWVSTMLLTLNTTLPAEQLVTLARQAVADLDPNIPVYDLEPLRDQVTAATGPRRFATALLGVFAGTALLLTLLGLHGVVSYSVQERRREIGVRMALGAQAGDVLNHVVGGGMILVGLGVLAGLALFAGAARVLGSLLYGVSPLDPVIILGGAAVLVLATALACYVPARRAAGVDPATVLRTD